MRTFICILSLAVLVTCAAANDNIKTIKSANLGGLGEAIQNQGSGFKQITGVNFEGLGGDTQTGGTNFKRIVGINLGESFGDSQNDAPAPDQAGMLNVTESSVIVYIGGSTIPLSSYQTAYGNYLWMETDMGWSQYVKISQYSGLSLIAYTPTGGQGEFLELYPSSSGQGKYAKTYLKLYPGYNRIMYHGDVAGRHHLLFTLNNQPSNSIIIDVTGGQVLASTPVLGTPLGVEAA